MSWDEGFRAKRELGDGRAVWIYPLMFTHSICIGKIDYPTYDDRWCYENFDSAKAAVDAWDPLTEKEPEGWHRHPTSGRRRPGGDKEKEHVNP